MDRKEYNRLWRQRNKDKNEEYRKKWRERNKEKVKAQNQRSWAKWYATHKHTYYYKKEKPVTSHSNPSRITIRHNVLVTFD